MKRTTVCGAITPTLLTQVKGFIEDADYNGKTLIGNITGSNGCVLFGLRHPQ